MKTFKILGLLLTYPEGSVLQAQDYLISELRDEALLPASSIKQIDKFLDTQNAKDILEVQEDYVATFDRGRAHCLHLFEHIHSESRERGQAMVNLIETYAERGLFINENHELPDYLPLFLEYLSMCPLDEACAALGEVVDIIAMIATKLKKRKSPYAPVFSAIEILSAVKPDRKKIDEAVKNAPQDPQTLEELDEQWAEAEAFSGDPHTDAAPCNAFPNATRALDKMMGDIS